VWLYSSLVQSIFQFVPLSDSSPTKRKKRKENDDDNDDAARMDKKLHKFK
jgi:hypothetical protein